MGKKNLTASLVLLSTAIYFNALQAETLSDCSKIESMEERVACYDRLAGRVEQKMEEEYEGTTQQQIEKKNEAISKEILGEEAPQEELMVVEIARVLHDRNKRVIFVTTDGRVFKKSASTASSFSVGDKLRMEKGFLSAVFLVREDGMRIKVQEISK